MESNQKLSSIYPLPTLLTPLPLIPFTTEEVTGCTNEAAKCEIQEIPLLVFIFHVLLSQQLHQLIHPNLLMTL